MKQWLKTNWVLVAVILIAAFFRFWQIGHLPGGLFPDEAAYGIDGRSITNGDLQPFYERGNGREGLFMYFLALAISIFGYHPWANQLVTASFGLGTVIVTYYIGREVFGKKTGLLASFLMAISPFAVTVTRTAFRANTLPFFAALTILFTIRIFSSDNSKSRTWNSIWAGLFAGLTTYTYISNRMLYPMLFGFFVILLFSQRSRIQAVWFEYKKAFLCFALVFLATFAWIGYYFFVSHPDSFIGRAGQVSVFSPELNHGDLKGTIISVLEKTALGFLTAGDMNYRHNVSGYPFLPPLVSAVFVAALLAFTWQFLVLLKQAWKKDIHPQTAHRSLLAIWFWFMTVPEITTAEGIPHGLRLIGTIPVIFLISAAGLMWFYGRLKEGFHAKHIGPIVAGIFLLTLGIYSFNLYFGVAANDPDYYYQHRADLTAVSEYLNQRNLPHQTYLSLDAFSVQTVDYLTTPKNQPYMLLIPEKTYLQELQPGDQLVFTQSTIFDSNTYKDSHPDIKTVKEVRNQFGQLIMIVLEK